MSKPPGDISPKIDAASETLSPKELMSKPMSHMTKDELFRFMKICLGYPVPETDLPENKQFMEDACDAFEKLGNNGEPIQPEDCDTNILEEE